MSVSEKSSISSSRRNLTVDIIRDPGFCGEWLNRFCKNAETRETLYYCDVYDDLSFEIHRGNKYGPIVGRTKGCSKNPGATDLFIGGPHHIHHDESTLRTHFTENGRRYHWNSGTELVEDDTGNILAQLILPVNNVDESKTGRLVIHDCPEELVDPVVMSALMVQEKSDEAKSWF